MNPLNTKLLEKSHLENLAEQYAEEKIEAVINVHSLLPKEAEKEKLRQEYLEAVSVTPLSQHLKKAVQIIRTEGATLLEKEQWESLEAELSNSSSYQIDKIKTENLATQQHISEKSLETVDEIVRIKFEQGDKEEALSLLIWLTTMADDIQEYWFDLGVCCQELGEFQKAINAYGHSLNIEPTHIASKAYSAECLLKLNKTDEARTAWGEAVAWIREQNQEEEWKEFSDTFSLLLGPD